MNTATGPLHYDATIGNSQFNRTIEDMIRNIQGLSNSAVKETQKIDDSFSRLGRLAGGYFAFTELSQLPGKVVQVRGEFQQLEIAFTTMLKSKSKADQLMAEVVQLAATTPFGLRDASAATKQLLAYGSASNEVIGELRMLGDVAAGVGAPIGDLAYLYGTLRTQGRAMTVDIRQFAGRGIPIYEELAKVLKINTDQVSEFVEAGKVGFKDVQQAFRNMSGEGGTFANLMAQQSKSLTGLTSQFSDALDVMLNNIGQSNEGLAATVISSATTVVEGYQQVIDVLTVLVATYGAYKAAIITVNAIKAAEATSSALISASVDKQSGSYAREIALKVKSAQATAQRTAALAEEAFAQSVSAAANVQALRTEVSAAAAKKASAIESAKAAAAEIASAQARLTAAQVNQAATARNLNASVRSAAAKEVEVAQNALLVASENGVAARKAASAASTDFLTKKTALETAAKTANTLAAATNATAATASVAAANASAIASTRLTAVQSLQIAVTRQLALAQAAFNASLLSNPIVLATTALVALAGAVWYLSDGTTAAEVAQKSYTKAIEDDKKAKDELISKTGELTSVLNNNAATNFQQVQAYNALQQLYPKVLGNLTLLQFKLLDATEAQKLLNKAIDEMGIQSQSKKYDDAQSKVEELTKKLLILQKQQGQSGIGAGGLTVPIEDTRKALEAAKIEAKKLGEAVQQNEKDSWIANEPVQEQVKHYQSIKDGLVKQRKELETNITQLQRAGVAANSLQLFFANMSLSGVVQQLDQVSGKLEALAGKPNVMFGGNKSYWEKVKKEATESLDNLGVSSKGSKEWNDLAKQIENADKKLEAYSLKQKKVAEKDKPQPFGSIAYWEQVSRKAQEVIDKTPASNSSVIFAQSKIKLDADKTAEDIRKSYAIKSYEDEINEKKAQYELYQRWVAAYGQKAADNQFATLVAGNQSYLDYLNGEIRKLESTANYVKLNAADSNKLDFLNTEKDKVTGKSSGLEIFNQQLRDAEINSASLTETLEKLAIIQDELGTPKTEEDFSKIRQVAQLRQEIRAELRGALNDFLVDANVNGAKILAVEKKYLELKAEAQKKFSGEELKGAVKAIDKRKTEELDAIKDEEFEKTDSFKRIHKEYLDYGRRQIKQRIDDIKKALETEKLSIDEREKYELKLAQTKRELNKNTTEGIKEAAGLLDSVLGDTGLTLSKNLTISIRQISSALNDVATLMDDSASTTEQVGSIIGIVTFAITSARDAMLKASDLATAMDGQVETYQLMANELAGINILLERQKTLLDDLKGIDKAEGTLALYEKYAKQQEDALTRLQQLTVDTIASQQEVFIDPVFNTKVKNKGFGGFWTQLMTGGKAKTKIEYQFESVDTSGFDDIEDYIGLLAEIKAGGGKLYGKEVVEADIKALETLIETYNEAVEQQKALMEELKTYFTGTTQEQIADSIVDGFMNGKRSAMDFADDFEKMMMNAVANSLKAQLLDADMKAFYDKFSEYSLSDFTLTEAEILELRNLYNQLLAEGQKKFDQIEAIAGVDLNANTGSAPKAQQGVVSGASQESINILEGQITAMRIIEADHLIVSRSALFELSGINQNTKELYAMRKALDNIDRALNYDWLRSIGGG